MKNLIGIAIFIPWIHLYTGPTLVRSSVGLILSFSNTIWVSKMRISHFSMSVGYGYFENILILILFSLYTRQEPSNAGKIALVSIWFRVVLTQPITRIYKDSLTLRYQSNMNIWLVSQFWYPVLGSLIPALLLIINTISSPIYWSKIGPVVGLLNSLDALSNGLSLPQCCLSRKQWVLISSL